MSGDGPRVRAVAEDVPAWWTELVDGQSDDPFEPFHRGRGMRRMVVFCVSALAAVAAASATLVVLAPVPPTTERAAVHTSSAPTSEPTEAAAPQPEATPAPAAPDVPPPTPSPSAGWNRQVLALDHSPAEVRAGSCVQALTGADVVWVVPCDHADAQLVAAVVWLPGWLTEFTALRQYVFEQCFAQKASGSYVDDRGYLTNWSAAADWMEWSGSEDRRAGVFTLLTPDNAYTARHYPDGLVICTEYQTA